MPPSRVTGLWMSLAASHCEPPAQVGAEEASHLISAEDLAVGFRMSWGAPKALDRVGWSARARLSGVEMPSARTPPRGRASHARCSCVIVERRFAIPAPGTNVGLPHFAACDRP